MSCGCTGDERTELAVGEVRNPSGTERLMRYWTTGPGAVKIGWGKPCDFCSCLRQLRKHVPRRMLKGLCANLHKRALGQWPGEHTVGRDKGRCPC